MSVEEPDMNVVHLMAVHAVLLCCVLVIIGGCGCERHQSEQASGSDGSRLVPVLVLERRPAYPGPDEPMVSGVLAKLWSDGLLLRSTDAEKPSSSFHLGMVGKEELAHLLLEIDAIVAKGDKSSDLVVDAASLELTIERGNQRTVLAESIPLAPNTPLIRIREHIFRLSLMDVQTVNDPASIR